MCGMMVLYCGLLAATLLPQEDSTLKRVGFLFRTEKLGIIPVYVKPRRDGSLSVRGAETKYHSRMSPAEVQARTIGPPMILRDPGGPWLIYTNVFVGFVLPMGTLTFIYMAFRRERNLRRMLAIESENPTKRGKSPRKATSE